METEVKVPAGPRGAGPVAVGAPVREKIEELLVKRMDLLVGDCGPIDVESAAKWLTEVIIELFKKHVETKRQQIREVLDLLAQDVYLSGCRMDINKSGYVDRIVEIMREGL